MSGEGGNITNDADNLWLGVFGVTVASIIWGSCFVVIKGYDLPKDGVHFAFLMSIGILLVGMLTLFSSEVEDGDFKAVFSPNGLLGGALWACGNFLSVPIVEGVGLGVGLALWAGTQMIVSFVVGAIGLEGLGLALPKESLERPICGIFGVLLAIVALVLFATVKPTTAAADGHQQSDAAAIFDAKIVQDEQDTPVTEQSDSNSSDSNHLEVSLSSSPSPRGHSLGNNDDDEDPLKGHKHIGAISADDGGGESPNVTTSRFSLGILMAIVAGTFYGVQFVPLSIWNTKVIHNGHIFGKPMPSDAIRALRFFFSQFAGTFLMALLGFVIYCIWTRNRPKLVPPEATLPCILCGAVWALGCGAAMLATVGLGNAVGLPLLLNCCFLVNSAWSIFYFKEILGRRNLRCFGAAFAFNVASSVLISLAKGS